MAEEPEWGLRRRRARDPFLEQHGGWESGERLRHSVENAQGRERMGCYVLGFQEIDQTQVAVVGGKSANWVSCADRRPPRAGWLLRDDGRLQAVHG